MPKAEKPVDWLQEQGDPFASIEETPSPSPPEGHVPPSRPSHPKHLDKGPALVLRSVSRERPHDEWGGGKRGLSRTVCPGGTSASSQSAARGHSQQDQHSQKGPGWIDRSINHRKCDQALLAHCKQAIRIKEERTGHDVEKKEEFLWRCLAQPQWVRSALLREDNNRAHDPVKNLVQKSGEFKSQWLKKGQSEERWAQRCGYCDNAPYVSWDVCFRCGSFPRPPQDFRTR